MLTCTISYHGKTNAERSIGRTFYLHIFLLAMDTIEIRIECDYSRAVFVDGRCQISRHRDRIFSFRIRNSSFISYRVSRN